MSGHVQAWLFTYILIISYYFSFKRSCVLMGYSHNANLRIVFFMQVTDKQYNACEKKQSWLTRCQLNAHLGCSQIFCYTPPFFSHNIFHQSCPHSHYLHCTPIFLQYSDLHQRKTSSKRIYAMIRHT